ncbi:PoNe immunity protein domain-containing protein [Variovorax sp. 770b2]|uniref:PoNe immunity protein domain-containing protein n=1 Tax=Variovorax sp. 770b2 TaxID=1566271 RepID=UPI0021087B3C|nr:PoNe immunity protein domain-containing protein [Variovorax sp. 770b2]
MDEDRAKERDGDLTDEITRSLPRIADETRVHAARGDYAWSVATSTLELLILRYTAGYSITELSRDIPSVIEAFDAFIPFENPPPYEAHTLTITQLEAYVYVMWLLALCRLLDHAELIPTVMSWLDKNAEFNRGRDGLFEAVVEKLTGRKEPVERVLLHPAAYRPLAKATAPDAQDRPALVKEFLNGWYKNMTDCYWHGTHTDKEGSSYFGYWAFEAALVTVLWDIDDSSYRDHLVYPKDLVDWAREHRTEAVPSGPSRTPGGESCSQAGWWFTPALKGSRRYFKQGEVMPVIEGSDYGSTFWQWDADQSAPKL